MGIRTVSESKIGSPQKTCFQSNAKVRHNSMEPIADRSPIIKFNSQLVSPKKTITMRHMQEKEIGTLPDKVVKPAAKEMK